MSMVGKKVRCIDACLSQLTAGEEYEVVHEHNDYYNQIDVKDAKGVLYERWGKHRFVLVNETTHPWIGKMVRCIEPDRGADGNILLRNEVYSVVSCNERGYLCVKDNLGKTFNGWSPDRFELIETRISNVGEPTNIDAEELRLRNILTRPSSDNCAKCGAPKSCAYHQ
jgi:hypothetical protein